MGLKTAIRMKNAIEDFNRMACAECKDGEFITLFFATIDAEEKTISYCNCGHEPTILLRDGEIVDLKTGGLVLGVVQDAKYEVDSIELKHGDCLLFYTDGLIDAVNFDGELWGRERLVETTNEFVNESAEHMIRNILRYRRRFVGLARQLDDTSIVVVKVAKQ